MRCIDHRSLCPNQHTATKLNKLFNSTYKRTHYRQLIGSTFNVNFGSESENDYSFLPFFFLLIATIKLPLLSNKNNTHAHTHHRLCWIVAQEEAKRKMDIVHFCVDLIFCIFFHSPKTHRVLIIDLNFQKKKRILKRKPLTQRRV